MALLTITVSIPRLQRVLRPSPSLAVCDQQQQFEGVSLRSLLLLVASGAAADFRLRLRVHLRLRVLPETARLRVHHRQGEMPNQVVGRLWFTIYKTGIASFTTKCLDSIYNLRHRLLYNWTVHGKWRYCITALKSPPVHRIEFVF